MTQSSWPDPALSRAVSDVQYEQLVAAQYVDGQLGSPADTPMVVADGSGRQVTVRAGRLAQLRGHGWTSGPADVVLAVAANSSGSSRTDLVVLGLSRTTWAVTAYVKTGTPGAGAPVLQLDTGDTGFYEMPLAEVTVPSGAALTTADQVKPRAWWTRPDGAASAGTDTRPPSPWPGMRLWESGTTYVWTGTLWERTSNPPTPVQTTQGVDITGGASIPPGLVGDSTWRDLSPLVWAPLVFTVPQSGRVYITVSGWVENHVDTSSTIWLSWRAAGGGITAGTASAVMNARGISTRGGRMVGSRRVLVTGLIPGATVTLTPSFYATAVAADITVSALRSGSLLVEPAA